MRLSLWGPRCGARLPPSEGSERSEISDASTLSVAGAVAVSSAATGASERLGLVSLASPPGVKEGSCMSIIDVLKGLIDKIAKCRAKNNQNFPNGRHFNKKISPPAKSHLPPHARGRISSPNAGKIWPFGEKFTNFAPGKIFSIPNQLIINPTMQYETVFILTPVLSDVRMKEAVEKFAKVLTDNGAEIVNTEEWGLRKKLAYPIREKIDRVLHPGGIQRRSSGDPQTQRQLSAATSACSAGSRSVRTNTQQNMPPSAAHAAPLNLKLHP